MPPCPTAIPTSRPSWRSRPRPRLEKEAIGRAAAELVAPGDPILIGPGTTTLALARQLRSIGDLTVVTNSLLVVEALLDAPGIDVIVTGGSFRHSIRALVGPGVTESLSRLRLPTVFISGNGLSRHPWPQHSGRPGGVGRPGSARLGGAVRRAGRSHQVRQGENVVTAPPEHIDVLITDDEAPPDELVALADAGVETVVASGQTDSETCSGDSAGLNAGPRGQTGGRAADGRSPARRRSAPGTRWRSRRWRRRGRRPRTGQRHTHRIRLRSSWPPSNRVGGSPARPSGPARGSRPRRGHAGSDGLPPSACPPTPGRPTRAHRRHPGPGRSRRRHDAPDPSPPTTRSPAGPPRRGTSRP